MQCDWARITSLSYQTLIELDLHEFPIQVDKLKFKNVRIVSYQKYANITGIPIEMITSGHEFDDAFLLMGLRPGLKFILYNREKYNSRLRHTLLHEVGHIKCYHQKHSEQEEIEAHFFAAQANAPNVLIKTISQRGYKIDVQLLMVCFGLSEESANKKLNYLKKYTFNHSNEYDDVISAQFSDFLNHKYPNKSKHINDDYYDDLERERQKWY